MKRVKAGLARSIAVTTVAMIAGFAPSAGAQVWYWCPAPQGYYPTVAECPNGWVRVAPQTPYAPPPLSQRRFSPATGLDIEIEAQRRSKEQERLKAEREKEQAALKEKAEKAAADRRLDDERVALKTDDEAGYHRISITDFKLDGKTLAAAHSPISVKGAYTKPFDSDFIFAGPFNNPIKIGLLTEDADREARALFLKCQQTPFYYSMNGCRSVVVIGHVVTCTFTGAGTREEPCIVVERARETPSE